MLFNSFSFLFVFLPVVVAGYFVLGSTRYGWAKMWLIGASCVFYGWWNPAYLLILIGSIGFNFSMGLWMLDLRRKGRWRYGIQTYVLTFSVLCNLSLLAYFKYANFFIENINVALSLGWTFETLILPLAISFFTFQQITYLVDVSRGDLDEHNFVNYALFVMFFPQLIAGPIVHHKEMLPQFERTETYQPRIENFSVGLTIFFIGLFKKTVLADSIFTFASTLFTAADGGALLTMQEAWLAALAYTLQLYFDFSGYSDMAIGLALLFGVRLPLNFNSPYKAASMIEFWRRWHMTLSRFLRDYVYIPLGGSRVGERRRYLNLMVTMLLGGLWHGAGWTFIIWGGVHGFYLVVNHLWRAAGLRLPHIAGIGLTFSAAVVAWVFFRAETLPGALLILKAMVGGTSVPVSGALEAIASGVGIPLASGPMFPHLSSPGLYGYEWVAGLLMIAWFLPNTVTWVGYLDACSSGDVATGRGILMWMPGRVWAIAVGIVALGGILSVGEANEFLYFNF